MARLDRLGPKAREIAQAGAAIGREFAYDIVTAVSPNAEADTRSALDRLVAAGLVFQRGNPPVADYQFKHALVQDTAYGTLLRGPRQVLHGRIAAAIERRRPDTVEREPEILAHHLAEAGEFRRAVSFLFEAGRRAAARSANREAMAHLNRAVGMLASLPEDSGASPTRAAAAACSLGQPRWRRAASARRKQKKPIEGPGPWPKTWATAGPCSRRSGEYGSQQG